MSLINMHCQQFNNIPLLRSAKQNILLDTHMLDSGTWGVLRQWFWILLGLSLDLGDSTGHTWKLIHALPHHSSTKLWLPYSHPLPALRVLVIFSELEEDTKPSKDRLWIINPLASLLWAWRYLEFFRIIFLTFFSCWNTFSVSEGH